MAAEATVQSIIDAALQAASQAQTKAEGDADQAISYANAIATPDSPPAIGALALPNLEEPSDDLARIFENEFDVRADEIRNQIKSDIATFLNTYYPCGWITTAQKVCNKIQTALDEGGTGINEAVEQALWDRARNREHLLDERMTHAVSKGPASQGWSMPPGTVLQRQFQSEQDAVNRDSTLSREIMIQMWRMELEMLQFFTSTGVQMQQLLMSSAFNYVNARLRAYTDPIRNAAGLTEATKDLYTQSLQFYRTKIMGEELSLRHDTADVSRSLDTSRIAIAAIESRAKNQTDAAMASARVQGDIAASARASTNTMASLASETITEN